MVNNLLTKSYELPIINIHMHVVNLTYSKLDVSNLGQIYIITVEEYYHITKSRKLVTSACIFVI